MNISKVMPMYGDSLPIIGSKKKFDPKKLLYKKLVTFDIKDCQGKELPFDKNITRVFKKDGEAYALAFNDSTDSVSFKFINILMEQYKMILGISKKIKENLFIRLYTDGYGGTIYAKPVSSIKTIDDCMSFEDSYLLTEW